MLFRGFTGYIKVKPMAESASQLELDLSHVVSRGELHALLANELGFPAYYGRNWDAFWDCVRDEQQSKMPSLLVLRGLSALRQILPRDAACLEQCMAELPGIRPDVQVSWV